MGLMGMTLLLIVIVAAFVIAAVLFVRYTSKKTAMTADQILTARGSTKWWQVTLSTLAVLMGSWALFSPGETAIIGGLPGCVMFTAGSVLGIIAFGFVGRGIRRFLPNGSSGTEFMGARYGRMSYYLMTVIGVFGMAIMLTSELTGIASAFHYLWNIPRWIVIIVILCGVIVYTTYGGIKASLFVDSLQTVIIIPTLIVAFLCILSSVGGWESVTAGIEAKAPQLLDWGYAKGWEHGGGFALGLFTAIFVDQSYWQRTYAVKNEKDIVKTFTCVGIIAIPMLLLSASFGLIAAGSIDVQNPSVALFELLGAVAPAWLQAIVLILALALIMSTVGGAINGITSVIAVEAKNVMARRAKSTNIDSKRALWIARVSAFCITLIAGSVALKGISVLYMFNLSNVFVTSSVVPLFYGMKNRRLKDWGVIAAFLCGVAAALVWLPDPTWTTGNTLLCMLSALVVPAGVSIVLGAFGKPVDMSDLQNKVVELK